MTHHVAGVSMPTSAFVITLVDRFEDVSRASTRTLTLVS